MTDEASQPPIRKLLNAFSAEVANPRRLQYPEILSWVLIVAFSLIVVASVVAAIMTSNIQTTVNASPFGSGTTTGEPISYVLVTATAWAGRPEVVLILLGAVGLAWWLVESWSDGHDENDEPVPDEVKDRSRNLFRASAMATSAGGLLLITAMAAIGLAVGTCLDETGSDSVTWAFRLDILGPSAATFLISAAGLFGVYLLRRQLGAAYSYGPDEAEATEDAGLD